jgi:serine O-acetyltransferase
LFYLCSVEAYKQKKINLAKKFFLINKIINGVDLFYEVKLPKIFLFSHPHSAIIGRANYSDYTMFSQGVTIGRKRSHYPYFGDGIVFYSGSKVIGKCRVGKNVIFAPGSIVIDTNIPDNSVVIGQHPNIIIKKNKFNLIKDFFKSKKKLIL